LAENYYLPKIDPKGFLNKFVVKEGNIYLPTNNKVRVFTEWYYQLYKEIGQIKL